MGSLKCGSQLRQTTVKSNLFSSSVPPKCWYLNNKSGGNSRRLKSVHGDRKS